MKYGRLLLEKREYVYLKRILNISGYVGDHETQRSLTKLSEELKSAQVVDEENLPKDVVRFNSQVTVISDKGWERSFQVVIPVDRDFNQNKISVLTPMGSALMGYSENDTVDWDFPGGKETLKITKVVYEHNYKGIDILL